MTKYKFLFLFTVILTLSLGCQEKSPSTSDGISKVEIKKINGEYDFYVDGDLFQIKGAGLDFNQGQDFKSLKEAGANSFRTWRTEHAEMELDSAVKYGLKIAMGLDMDKELHDFDYDDETAVKEQFEKIKKEVLKYKDHPNLLCWVAGNELNLLIKDDGSLGIVNPKVYDALSDIVDFIHEVDPLHPVTTTFAAGAMSEHIKPVLERCPQLDFLSYQVYYDLVNLPKQEKSNNLDIPYLVTEFGPKGHWERPATAWGREIEENSTEKATGLWDRMKIGLQSDDTGRNMGGYAFVWGQKQERTPTWYGIFNKDGRPIAVLDELTRFWSGKYPADRAPEVQSFTLEGMVGTDNINLKAGKEYSAEMKAIDHDGQSLRYRWELMKEVAVRSDGGAYEAEPDVVDIDVLVESSGKLSFRAPKQAGEYRLFCYVYDDHKVANANIPFLVE